MAVNNQHETQVACPNKACPRDEGMWMGPSGKALHCRSCGLRLMTKLVRDELLLHPDTPRAPGRPAGKV